MPRFVVFTDVDADTPTQAAATVYKTAVKYGDSFSYTHHVRDEQGVVHEVSGDDLHIDWEADEDEDNE